MTTPATSRLSEQSARDAIESHLREEFGCVPAYRLIEDGETGWAFWISEDGCEDDTTSYVHADGTIEWYGTRWTQNDD